MAVLISNSLLVSAVSRTSRTEKGAWPTFFTMSCFEIGTPKAGEPNQLIPRVQRKDAPHVDADVVGAKPIFTKPFEAIGV